MPVAAAFEIIRLRLIEQQLDFLAAQDLRELFLCLFNLDVVDGVDLDLILRHCKEIQALERGERTGDRCRGLPGIVQPQRILAHDRLIRV